MIQTPTKNIDTTSKLTDLSSGKIPVGIEGGDWAHITPQELADGIQSNVEQSIKEEFVESVSTSVTESVKESMQSAVSSSVNEALAELDIPDVTGLAQKSEIVEVVSESVDISTVAVDKPTLFYCTRPIKRLKISTITTNLNEVTFLFSTPSTPTEVIIPVGFKSVGAISILPDKMYIMSILHGVVTCRPITTNL